MSAARALAGQIADNLFINGAGEKARRLVLELEDGRDGGGWCKEAVVDAIEARLPVDEGGERCEGEGFDSRCQLPRGHDGPCAHGFLAGPDGRLVNAGWFQQADRATHKPYPSRDVLAHHLRVALAALRPAPAPAGEPARGRIPDYELADHEREFERPREDY